MDVRLGGSDDIDVTQLARLFEDAGWAERARHLSDVVAGSRFVVTAWDECSLVGFGRAYSDGV